MRELALYLSRKQADYKTGIPFNKPESRGEILFILEKDSESNRELLQAIIERGLKLRSADQTILTAEEAKGGEVAAGSTGKKFRMAVLFGQASNLALPEDLPVLKAPALEKIKSEPEIKKDFWMQLKNFEL